MKHPVHVGEVAFETWYAGTDREIRGKALGDVGGAAKVGVGVLELPPGSNRTFELRPGSFVCFPAGQSEAHYLDNTGAETFTYLIVGERIADDEVVYPSGP